MNSDSQNSYPMLPPKLNETERMVHVQHWINNLPIDVESCSYAPSAPDSSSDSCLQINVYNQISFGGDVMHSDSKNKTLTCSNRLFTESETQLLVDLFKDYFISGICPPTDEIRKRTGCTELALYRNPTSLRGKVKRMISNRKWVGYIRHS